MQQFYSVILQAKLFNQIKRHQLPALLAAIKPTLKTFTANTRVWQVGATVPSFGLVCAGQVQIVKENAKGNRTILAKVGVSDIFGEAYACTKHHSLSVAVDTITTTKILFFRPENLFKLTPLTAQQQLIVNLLQIFAQKNLLLNQKVEILSQRRIADKVLTYLQLEQQKQISKSLLIPYNRQEMADFLGVERSALSTTLGEMQQADQISYYKNHFTLL